MLETLSTSPNPPRNIPANIRAVQHVNTMAIIKCMLQVEEVNGGTFKSREGCVARGMGCSFFKILDHLKSLRMACGPEKHVCQNASPAVGWHNSSVRLSFGFVKLKPIHICA